MEEMQTQQYTLDEIFEKRLLFLLPFYVFSHESRFEEYEQDEKKLELLKEQGVRLAGLSHRSAAALAAIFLGREVCIPRRVLRHRELCFL